MNDKELEKISHEIDEFLLYLSIHYALPPLNLSGVMLARLVHLTENNDDLYRLFLSIGNKDHLKNTEEAIH
jgi:hypothetical protein